MLTDHSQHNRLREYKSEVYRLQKDLKEQKEQGLSVKNQYADWNKKLQDKIRDFRNEKTAWLSEAAALRAADKEAKVGPSRCGRCCSPDKARLGHICSAEETAFRRNKRRVRATNEGEGEQTQN